MDDLFKRCVCEGYEYQIRVWEQMDVSSVTLSDVFPKRMERLIRRKRQSRILREVRRYAVGAAAMFGVIIILLRPQYAVNAFDMIMEWFKNHVRIIGEDGPISELPRYTVGYVPEGFCLTEEEHGEFIGFQVMRKEGAILYFTYETSNGTTLMDSENMSFEVYHLQDGTILYCFVGEGEKRDNSATWLSEDGKVRFSIFGEAPIEEILKMCEDISEVM